MWKKKKYNYKIVVEFGNGKTTEFKADRLEGLFRECKRKAGINNSFFLCAQIIPLSKVAKLIIKKDYLVLDSIGQYYYYNKGAGIRFVSH